MQFKIKAILTLLLVVLGVNLVRAQSLEEVTWSTEIGFCKSSSEMIKCVPNGWNNAGYVSNNVLKAGVDGEMVTTVKDVNYYQIIGFSPKKDFSNNTEIVYGIKFQKDQFIAVEHGGPVAYGNRMRVGDQISIKKEANIIKYYHNGRIVHTSKIPVKTDLYIATTAYSTNVKRMDVKATFSAVILKDATWSTEIGFCPSGSERVKCVSNSWNNAGYVSSNMLKNGEDGEVEAIVKDLHIYQIFGLSPKSSFSNNTEIVYGIKFQKDRLIVVEHGGPKAYGVSMKVGDKLSIKKEGGIIKYLHNDVLVHTSEIPVTTNLFIATTAYSTGTKQMDVRASFDPAPVVISPNMVTAKKNSRIVEIGNELSFYYKERYNLSSGSELSFKVYNMTQGKRELTALRTFSVEMGVNEYRCGTSELIASGDLVENNHYRIEIYGNKGEYRYLDFIYKTN